MGTVVDTQQGRIISSQHTHDRRNLNMIVYCVYSDDTNKKMFVYAEDMAILLAGKSTIPQGIFYCTGEKKAADWHSPALEWFDGDGLNLDRYKDPDFAQNPAYSYILGPRAAELLRPVISDVAELLPIPF
jgi:hypothetical protein